jgi:hypothetical protein
METPRLDEEATNTKGYYIDDGSVITLLTGERILDNFACLRF